MRQPLRVLMLSVDPSVPGGIAQFIETLQSHLLDCQVTQLSIGSIPGQSEGVLAQLSRLITVPVKVLCLELLKPHDVVHLNTSLCPKSAVRDALILIALRASRRRNVLLYIHGWQWSVARVIEGNAVVRWLGAFLLNGARQILVLAPEFKVALARMGADPDRVEVTRTMFDGEVLSQPSEAMPQRRSILFMSRFDRLKGVYELTSAFARLASEYTDVDLILAGDGQEADGLRELVSALGIQDRVRFPGYVRGSEKGRLLNACTIYALPSYGEGMPIALLEALAAGKSVLTTYVGGIPQIVRDNENGILLRTVTTDAIAEALGRMLSDPGWCAAVGAANRKHAWDRFEARQVTAEIEAIYRYIARPAAPCT